MSATSPDRIVVDLLDPELYRRNPHEIWAWMRANEPVYRDHRNGLWAITRHADVMDVERRSTVFSSAQGYRAIWAPEEANMIARDEPQHRRQRSLVSDRFSRASVAQRAGEVAELVDELLDAVVPAGHMEVVSALAGQLSARLTCRLLGFPEDRWADVMSWSERLMRVDMRERDGRTFVEFVDANTEFATALG